MEYPAEEPSDQSSRRELQDDDDEDFGRLVPSCTMVCDYTNGKLGTAYYRSDAKQLFMSSDIADKAPFSQWKMAIMQISPDTVLISSRASDVLDDCKRSEVHLTAPEIRPRSEYNATNAIDRLVSIFVVDSAYPKIRFNAELSIDEARHQAAKFRLLGHIDGQATLSLGCVNVLLCLVQRRRDACNLHGTDYLREMIKSVGMFTLQDSMLLNADTFHSLRIFEDESQSKTKSFNNQTKENPSLFSIINICLTLPGRALMKYWFRAPTTNLEVLRARHDAVECFLMPINLHPLNQVMKILRRCQDMCRAVDHLSRGQYGSSRGSVWQSVLNFAFNAIKICDTVEQLHHARRIDVLERIMTTIDVDVLRTVGSLINDVIDFDGSEAEERIVVKRLVDEELDEHKDVYEGLEQVLDKVCSEVSQTLPSEHAAIVQCVYLPQLGFLISMPAQSSDEQSQSDVVLPIWQSEDWSIQFSTAENVYFKSEQMGEL